MTVSAITTLNPTPSLFLSKSCSESSTSCIPRVDKTPTNLPPQHIKEMRYLLVATLFFSAYAIYSSIFLTRLTYNLLPTVPLAVWTLWMLFPLELDHHEGVAQSERHLLRWIVDQRVVLNAQRTAAAWGLSAFRTVAFALQGMTPQERKTYAPDVWVMVALEVASAACLYLLSKRWDDENAKDVQDKELEKREAEKEKKAAKKGANASS